MCGVFGVVVHGAERPDRARLEASARRLGHRGPDANGIYTGDRVGLAHARLSLVDLSPRSNQPFADRSGRYQLVYNGEIYNFRALRAELEARGVEFRTTSDTEVLLELLIRDDPVEVLKRLEGMFAFALLDTTDDSLLLARDRFGMKPLYTYQDGARFAFTSEVKALEPWVELEPDVASICSYLLGFGGPTKGFTMYRGVRAVAPGEWLRVRPGKEIERGHYFRMADFLDPALTEQLDRLSPDEMVDHTEALLTKSVDEHMFADAQVGAFCSGGVDSSLLLALAAKRNRSFEIFHANVKGKWSETDAAKELARHLGLELRVVEVSDQDFLDAMPEVMRQYEHPYTYHPNCAPFMYVSRLAREHGVKGLLSGEGSDECFLGYPWFGLHKPIKRYEQARSAAHRLVHGIPTLGKVLLPAPSTARETVRTLLNRGEVAEDDRYTERVLEGLGPDNFSEGQRLSVHWLNYHLRTLLHRNDSLGMEASIEARFPFLYNPLVEMAVNMPDRYKLRFSPGVLEKAHPMVRDKWAVRKVADRHLPKSLSQRIKIGFWTTVFQRTQVRPDYFVDSRVRDLFEVSNPLLEGLVEGADQDLTMRLLHLDVWLRVCVAREDVQDVQRHVHRGVDVRPE